MSPNEWVPLRWSSGPIEALKGSPFNCLVVRWPLENSETLISAAKAQGLAVVGQVAGEPGAHVESAARQGLDAIITDKLLTRAPVQILPISGPAEASPQSPVPLKESEWPSVRVGRSGNAEAGPTGYPWVDANGWKCQLFETLHPGKVAWTLGEPKGSMVRAEMYALAVAD